MAVVAGVTMATPPAGSTALKVVWVASAVPLAVPVLPSLLVAVVLPVFLPVLVVVVLPLALSVVFSVAVDVTWAPVLRLNVLSAPGLVVFSGATEAREGERKVSFYHDLVVFMIFCFLAWKVLTRF